MRDLFFPVLVHGNIKVPLNKQIKFRDEILRDLATSFKQLQNTYIRFQTAAELLQ